jgi:hypothetical protein
MITSRYAYPVHIIATAASDTPDNAEYMTDFRLSLKYEVIPPLIAFLSLQFETHLSPFMDNRAMRRK